MIQKLVIAVALLAVGCSDTKPKVTPTAVEPEKAKVETAAPKPPVPKSVERPDPEQTDDDRCKKMHKELASRAAGCSPFNVDACAKMMEYQKQVADAGCMKPTKQACTTDEDCVVWSYDSECCPACQPTAVSKYWKQMNEPACHGERLEACPKMECKEAAKKGLVPKCQNETCVLAEP